MRRQPTGVILGLTVTLAIFLACPTVLPAGRPPQDARPASDVAVIPVDVAVLDRSGKVVDDLPPASFTVKVDGAPRRVLWVRYVSRGPGASDDAARRRTQGAGSLLFAAEPARDVVVVVDETSIRRGTERAVIEAAGALIDRLGLDDRLAVVRVPLARETRLTLTSDRSAVHAVLRQVAGRADRPAVLVDAALPVPQLPTPEVNRAGEDPGQRIEPERAPVRTEAGEPGRPGEDEPATGPDFVSGLEAILNALRSSSRRKVLAVFSGGLTAGSESRLDEVAATAFAAHAVIHAFALQGLRSDPAGQASVTALERLATATGGSFTPVGKNADKTVARVLPELSACYVLGIETVPSDADGTRHRLRVEAPGRALTLRAPAWLVPRADVDDMVPPAQNTPPASTTGLDTPSGPDARGAEASARDVALQRLLARAADYVARYVREYSLLVAEERYAQSTKTHRRWLRSDLLLVRPPGAEQWISFRDVFEVDGKPTRDRDDRLRRLFLEGSAEAEAQLGQIRMESARYNIGPVERNINVPLFPLDFLQAQNLPRFRFKMAGRKDGPGVDRVRVEYEEQTRPTLVVYNGIADLPARGSFLLDPASGAVVASLMAFELDEARGTLSFDVRYQRDEVLGLWVPAEMSEIYTVQNPSRRNTSVSIDARATYSKFRRFRVTTEEQLTIPK